MKVKETTIHILVHTFEFIVAVFILSLLGCGHMFLGLKSKDDFVEDEDSDCCRPLRSSY